MAFVKLTIGEIMRKALMSIMLALVIQSICATVLFFDDFNRTSGSAIGNGWVNVGPLSHVIEDGTAKVASDNLKGIRRDFSALGITSGSYYVSYDWKITSNNWLCDAFSTGNITHIMQDYEGNLYYDFVGDFGDPTQIGTLPFNTWVNVKLQVNIDGDWFSLWINNVLVADYIYGNSISNLNYFTFRASAGSTVTQYIDNFTIYNDVPPDPPTTLTAVGHLNDITLNWTAPANPLFVTYKIYRYYPAIGYYEPYGTSNTTNFVDTQLNNDTDYTYYVTSLSFNSFESGASDYVSATLSPVPAILPESYTINLTAPVQVNVPLAIHNQGRGILNYNLAGNDLLRLGTQDLTFIGSNNGHNYYKSNWSTDWWTAHNYCSSQGGHLLSILDESENSYISQNLDSMYWTGAAFSYQDYWGNWYWYWVNGDVFSYTNWASGYPQYNWDYKGCLDNAGLWYEISPGEAHPFIIEFESSTYNQTVLSFSNQSGTIYSANNLSTTMYIDGSFVSEGTHHSAVIILSNAIDPYDSLEYSVTINADFTPPLQPTGLVFNQSQSDANQINISWQANADSEQVVNYKVYRRNQNVTEWMLMGTVGSTQLNFTDNQFSGLDTTYVYYKIGAVDWLGQETQSESVMAWLDRFASPANISLEIIRNRHVKLSWHPVTQTMSGLPCPPTCYVVYKSNQPAPWENFVFTAMVTDTTYTHSWAAWYDDYNQQFYVITAFGGSIDDIRGLQTTQGNWAIKDFDRLLKEYQNRQ